jgi:hypothetical protein
MSTIAAALTADSVGMALAQGASGSPGGKGDGGPTQRRNLVTMRVSTVPRRGCNSATIGSRLASPTNPTRTGSTGKIVATDLPMTESLSSGTFPTALNKKSKHCWRV